MTNRKSVKLILERWIAELKEKDRTMANVANNFDELFSEWFHAGISFEDAYALVTTAIKAHLPSAYIARTTYKSSKQKGVMHKTESEFIEDWNRGITDTGMQVFYNYFQIDGETVNTQKTVQTYGSMSTGEYLKQRRYADAVPTLDVNSLPEFAPISEDDVFDPEPEPDDDCTVDLGEV